MGVAEFVWAVGLLAVVIVSAVLATKFHATSRKYKEEDRGKDYYNRRDTDGLDVSVVCLVILSFVSFGVCLALIGDAAQHVINPTYYGIHDLLCTVRTCTSGQ